MLHFMNKLLPPDSAMCIEHDPVVIPWMSNGRVWTEPKVPFNLCQKRHMVSKGPRVDDLQFKASLEPHFAFPNLPLHCHGNDNVINSGGMLPAAMEEGVSGVAVAVGTKQASQIEEVKGTDCQCRR